VESTAAGSPGGAVAAEPAVARRDIVDDLRRSVSVPVAPQRVVAGSPYAVEMMAAIGVTPVARPEMPESAMSAPELRAIPEIVMDHGVGPNMEQLASLQGDLMLTSPSFARFAPAIQESLQTPVAIYSIRSADDVPRVYRTLGELLGREPAAEAQAVAVERELAAIRSRHKPGDGPTVFAIFGTGESFYTFLPDSYLGSMVEALGGRLVSDGVEPMHAGGSMGVFSLETTVARQPSVILIAQHGGEVDPAAGMEEQAIWAALPAVKAGRVHRISEWDYLTSPGPSVLRAMVELEALLYPGVAVDD